MHAYHLFNTNYRWCTTFLKRLATCFSPSFDLSSSWREICKFYFWYHRQEKKQRLPRREFFSPLSPTFQTSTNLNYAGQLPMFLVGHFYSDTIRYTILFLLLIHIWFQANSILWYLLVEFLWNICLDLRLIIFSKDRRVASPPSLQDVQSVFSVISLIDVYRKMIERLFQIVLIWSVGESWLSFNN